MSGWDARRAERVARGTLAAGLLAAGSALAQPAPPDSGAAGSLEGRPIRAVELEIRDVFDPMPSGGLYPVYRLANGLHIRSRESTVRAHVLLQPGEPFSLRRVYQQERVLRTLDFLEPDRDPIRALPDGDSVTLRIRTRDVWTLQPELNVERGGGRTYGTIGVSDRNLLGLGKYLALFYSEAPEGVSRRVAYEDPAVLDSPVRFAYTASDGTSGATDQVGLWLPFRVEDDPVSWGVRWDRSGSVARLYEAGAEVAAFERDLNDFLTWFGVGRRDRGTVRRLTLSYRVLDRELGPSVAAPAAPEEFRGPAEVDRFRRVVLEGRVWRPRFVVRTRVGQPDRVEDADVGPSFSLAAGFSPRALGATDDEGYVESRLDFGGYTRLGIGIVRSQLSTRLAPRPVEILRSAEARWISEHGRWGLLLGASGAAGSRVPRDYQVVVGGLNGLRAFPVHQLAGREMLRLNAEQRVTIASDVGHLMSIGLAGFWDGARAWGPGAEGTGWHHDAGIGLRIIPPAVAYSQVLRIDVAWPLRPAIGGGHEAVISFGSTQVF